MSSGIIHTQQTRTKRFSFYIRIYRYICEIPERERDIREEAAQNKFPEANDKRWVEWIRQRIAKLKKEWDKKEYKRS